MKQTNVTKYILPDGVNFAISTDGGVSYDDVGLLAAGATYTHNFDPEQINGGNKAIVVKRIKNPTLAFAPSALWSQDLAVIAKLGTGIYTNTATASVLVEGETQTEDSGDWAEDKFILIENQNYDLGAITVNSVDGSVDHTLVVDTDYIVAQNEKGEYGIIILSTGGCSTETQDMVIDYDYTPAASNKITSGASTATLTNFIVRLRHYTNALLTTYDMEAFIYSAAMDSGLQLNFKGQNEDGLFETTVAFTGVLDEARSSGDQLFSWSVNTSALN